MLPRHLRLPKELIPAVLKGGRGPSSPLLAFKVVSGASPAATRFAIVVSSKELKRAVDRNKLKRRLRGLVIKLASAIKPNHQVVVLTRRGLLDLETTELEKLFTDLLAKAHLL